MKNNWRRMEPKISLVIKAFYRRIVSIRAIIISCFIGIAIFYFLNSCVILVAEKKESILTLIVSIVSITFAILVTYLFSKLFAERQERVNRKLQIDKLSFRLNELRDIAYGLYIEPQIWNQYPETKKLDKELPYLTVFQFRDYGKEFVGSEAYNEISEKYGGEVLVQAYLSLRELANDEFAARVDPLYVRDNTVDELGRFIECARHVSYFLSEFKTAIKLTDTHRAIRVSNIQESYYYLTGTKLDIPKAIPQLSILFSDMAEIELRKLQYFLYLNTRKLSFTYRIIWSNLIVYVIILISALIQFILLEAFSPTYVVCLVSWFVGNTSCITLTILNSLTAELNITEYATLDKIEAQTKQSIG